VFTDRLFVTVIRSIAADSLQLPTMMEEMMRSITTDKKNKDHVGISYGMIPDISEQSRFNTRYHRINIGRRTGDRIMVRDGIYAVIESLSPQICQITDMGEDGMSFVYFSDQPLDIIQGTVDFLVTGFGFKLESIPFRIVEEFRLSAGQTGRLGKRVARVSFTNLGEGRKEMVADFIAQFIEKTVN